MTIFKIYLSSYNSPTSHIDLEKGSFTHYNVHEEVLLAPFFLFQVADIQIDKRQKKLNINVGNGKQTVFGKVTTITLVELPYQNILKTR